MIWCLMLLPLVLVLSALQPQGVWGLEFCPSCFQISRGPGSPLHHSPFLKLGLCGLAVSASLFCSSLSIALTREARLEARDFSCGLQWEETSALFDFLFSFKVPRTSGCFQGQTFSWPVAGSVSDLAAVEVARISLGWIVLKQRLQCIRQEKGFSFDVSCYAGSFISADFHSQTYLLWWLSENAEWELKILCLRQHCSAVLICIFFFPLYYYH